MRQGQATRETTADAAQQHSLQPTHQLRSRSASNTNIADEKDAKGQRTRPGTSSIA